MESPFQLRILNRRDLERRCRVVREEETRIGVARGVHLGYDTVDKV